MFDRMNTKYFNFVLIGLKIILDFIPNHTSNLHPWFTQSKTNMLRNNTHRNYYVWTDMPTNWVSLT